MMASLGAGCGSTGADVSPVPHDGGGDAAVDATPSRDAGDAGADAAVDGGSPCDGVGPASDIGERLACVPGLEVVEVFPGDPGGGAIPTGYRRFDITIDQLSNHDDPKSVHFKQRLSLLHISDSAPLVLSSSGYGLYTGVTELTRAYSANQIQVEHRFFMPSRPEPTTWKDLTIKQSAADYHQIVTALKPIYHGHWVNTGGSKGGMTSIYHRRFYPQDLDGTVAYVAPLSYSIADARYTTFVNQVGGAAYATCRAKLTAFQRAILAKRDAIVPLMTGSFTQAGGPDVALEHAAVDLVFTFWQYSDPADPTYGCNGIPAATASASALYTYLGYVSPPYTDGDSDYFLPYYYQAEAQLGAPETDLTPVADLLKYPASYKDDGTGPDGVHIDFDATAMVDIQNWVKTDGSGLLFIYGEFDPWTAGKFELGAAKDSAIYIAPKNNHGSEIASLTSTDQDDALAHVTRWMGAPITHRPAFAPGGPRILPGDPMVHGRPPL